MSFLMPKQRKPRQQKPATKDDARERIEAQEDFAKRRGTAANILGGMADTQPQTATARLLGGGQ